MTTTTIHTPSGKAVEITMTGSICGVSCEATVAELGLRGTPVGPLPLPVPQQGATHYIKIGKNAVGLSADAAAAIETARGTEQAAWDASPEGQRVRLERQRESLEMDISLAADRQMGRRERAWARDGYASIDSAAETTARAALAAFDAAHPEILGAMKAERAEAADRLVRA